MSSNHPQTSTVTLKYDKYGHPVQRITNRPTRYPPSRTLEEYERMLNDRPFFRPDRARSSQDHKVGKGEGPVGSGRTSGLSFDLFPRIVSASSERQSNGCDRGGRVRFDTIGTVEQEGENRITPFPLSTSGRTWRDAAEDEDGEDDAPAVPPKPKMRKRYPPLPPCSPDRSLYHLHHPSHLPHPDRTTYHATPLAIPFNPDPRKTSREPNPASPRRSAMNPTRPQSSSTALTAPPASPPNTSHSHPHPHHPQLAQTIRKTPARLGRRDGGSVTEIRRAGGGGKAGSDDVSARTEAFATPDTAAHNARTVHTAHTTSTKRTNQYDPRRHPDPESPIDWEREARVVRDVKGGFERVLDPPFQSRGGKGEASRPRVEVGSCSTVGWELNVPNTNTNMGVGVGVGVGIEAVPTTATAPIIPEGRSRELTEMEDELVCPM